MTRFVAEIAPAPESIAQLTEDAAEFLRSAGVDPRAVHHVSLVIDELLTNLFSYGGNADAPASIVLEVTPEAVSGQIEDRGKPFDPRTTARPDVSAGAEEREIGGLGLELVRNLTSALNYRSDGLQNSTTFSVLRGAIAKPRSN
jgi:serine/threonine-protein kinase RsbW